MLCEALLAFMC